MRKGFLGSVGVLLAAAGFAFPQAPYYAVPYGYPPTMQPYYVPAPGYYNYGYAPGYVPAYAPGYAMPPASNRGAVPAAWTNAAVPAKTASIQDKELIRPPQSDPIPANPPGIVPETIRGRPTEINPAPLPGNPPAIGNPAPLPGSPPVIGNPPATPIPGSPTFPHSAPPLPPGQPGPSIQPMPSGPPALATPPAPSAHPALATPPAPAMPPALSVHPAPSTHSLPTEGVAHEGHPLTTTHTGSACGVDGCCTGQEGDEPPPGLCVWITVEPLLWWMKDPPLSTPLLTTGNIPAALAAGLPAGALGSPTTTVISPSSFPAGAIPGGRLNVGCWLTEDHHIGLEGSGFGLASQRKNLAFASPTDANTVLAVPAFLTTTGGEGTIVTATSTPGANTLTAALASKSELWGGEANFLFHAFNNNWFSLGLLFGGRYLDLTESLVFSTTLTGNSVTGIVPAPLVGGPGFTITATDRWGTHNQFYGGQIGFKADVHIGWFFADVLGKVAFGDMQEVLDQTGVTSFGNVVPPSPNPTGGNFNLITNAGRQTKDQFAVIPEVELQLGVEFNRNLRVFVAGDFLYVNTVVRPGNQIDHVINPSALPALVTPGVAIVPAQPSRLFGVTDFWAGGVSVGVEIRY